MPLHHDRCPLDKSSEYFYSLSSIEAPLRSATMSAAAFLAFSASAETASLIAATVSPTVPVSFLAGPFVVGVAGVESVPSASRRSISFWALAIFCIWSAEGQDFDRYKIKTYLFRLCLLVRLPVSQLLLDLLRYGRNVGRAHWRVDAHGTTIFHD